jgi:uncharacterized LabA/DUF88 family protein
MSKRCCLFVDGENLRHVIVGLFCPHQFKKESYLPRNANWGSFFDWLTEAAGEGGVFCERIRAYWYVVDLIEFTPYLPLPNELEMAIELISRDPNHKKWFFENHDPSARLDYVRDVKAELWDRHSKMKKRFDGWRRIQEEIGRRNDAVEFRRAGAITYTLFNEQLSKEKSVDVKLATDMIMLRDSYDVAVVVSGDQDYVPAVQAVKDSGKRVVNVAFKTKGGKFLPGGARRLNEHTDRAISVPYDQFKKFLRFESDEVRSSASTLT